MSEAKKQRPKEEEILIWAGVVAQLHRTQANRLLANTSLPYPLFVLLRHFAHNVEREWTVSGLSAAFQTGQSGMTKKVQKLIELKLLSERPDGKDKRMKWVRINNRGLKLLDVLSKDVRLMAKDAFKGWTKRDIDQLHESLFRLKSHLDENR